MNAIIVEILSRFLGDYREHNESKGQVSFNCPACAEEKGLYDGDGKYKLAINYKMGKFRCWVCAYDNNMRGKVSNLIFRYGNNQILKEYIAVAPTEVELIDRVNKVSLPEAFKPFKESSSKDYLYERALSYVKKRGVTDFMINHFNIGYTTKGKYKYRIIIPSYNEMGLLNFFTARAWDKWVSPKYLNPDADKQNIIYNEKFINWDATIYLVEGPWDHIVIPNSIPILGKVLSNYLKQTLMTKANGYVVLVLDEDAYDAAIEIYKDLNFGKLYNRIKICKMNYGDDPSLIFQKFGNQGIIKALKSSKQLKESELY